MAPTPLPIDGLTMIPELLRRYPQARQVLDRYGLQGCGGPEGPVESLAAFARLHDVPLERLLEEIRQVLSAPRPPLSPALPASSGPPRGVDAIYRPFFLAGILVTLTAGATWGAYLLLRIGWAGSFRAVGVHEINAHGHAQIFGWVGLFVMGFAYQAFPRFKHTVLAYPALAWASLVLMLLGIVGRSVGEPLAESRAAAGVLAVASAWLEVLAVLLFVIVIGATWRRAERGLTCSDGYILAALLWFAIQAVYEAVYLQALLQTQSREELLTLIAAWQGALRDIQIHGFALLMILGVTQRVVLPAYEMAAPSRRGSLAALALLNLAVLGEVFGLILLGESRRFWAGVWYASVLLLSATVMTLVWHWGIFRPVREADRSLKFIRAAYAWLLLSLAMLVLLPGYQFGLLPKLAPESLAVQIGFSHAYYGAARHAVTVGFISLMILGMAARVVPTLQGVDPRRLPRLWVPFVLLNAGCTLRVVGQTMTDFLPSAYPLMAASGVLEVAALALWSGHLVRLMFGGWRSRTAELLPYIPGTPIEEGHSVGEILARYPELLETFLALGFRPLAQSWLRQTLAYRVSIGQACRYLGLPTQKVLAALNQAREALPPSMRSLPVLTS
ncbi:NnrS family protein [Thermogemmata fonticola]|uniref:NnrS family protein n=1 Tax=Thermogemmata fonticola TaxID=2755323 RepID=A0A7V9ACQ1_9BACT|nr:NnrS family protein [Thermogemmata fonticola]MBA2227002.1 NnrS family protein [Thermogemmata fonticola]